MCCALVLCAGDDRFFSTGLKRDGKREMHIRKEKWSMGK